MMKWLAGMFKRISYNINSMSIRWKLTVMFVIISIIPAYIVGVLSLESSSNIIIEHHLDEIDLRLNLIENDVQQYILRSVDYTSARLATTPSVRRLLGNRRADYTYEQREADKQALRSIFLDNVFRQGTDSIYVFTKDGEVYTNDSMQYMKRLPLSEQELEAFDNSYTNVFIGRLTQISGRNFFPYIRKIHYPVTDIAGYAVINIRLQSIDSLYATLASEARSDVYVVDKAGTIISTSVPSVQGMAFDTAFPNVAGHQSPAANEARFGDEVYVFSSKYNEKLDWTVYAFKKKSIIVSETRQIGLITVLAVLLSFIICIALAILFSATITKPIKKLIKAMQTSPQDSPHEVPRSTFTPDYDDEIGMLGKSFIAMSERLSDSITDIYLMEAKKREAEFKAFESQIKPHFLYNTLSTIIWLIENGRKDEAIDVTNALSTMLRESIGRGGSMHITLGQEFKHLLSYMSIQQVRYKKKFTCVYLVDEMLLQYQTVRIILQPLAENAIYHGVKNLESGGIIKFIGQQEGNTIILEVWDNGNRVTSQELAGLNRYLEYDLENPDFGIGIRNVHNRIRHYYGPEYGLDFRKEGIFTVARIRIRLDKDGSS